MEEVIAPQSYNELTVKVNLCISVQCSLHHTFTSSIGASPYQGCGWVKGREGRDLLCIIYLDSTLIHSLCTRNFTYQINSVL